MLYGFSSRHILGIVALLITASAIVYAFLD